LGFIGILGAEGFSFVGDFGLLLKFNNHFSGFLGKEFELRLHLNDFDLEFGDFFIGFLQSLKSNSVLLDFGRKDALLVLHHFDVKFKQLKVRGWSDVIFSSQFSIKLVRVVDD
jgi:hypothetical protein